MPEIKQAIRTGKSKLGKVLSVKPQECVAVYSKLLWDRGLTEGTGGNVSMRDGDSVYITPTSMIKHFLTAEDIVELAVDGTKIAGKYNPSSEYKMHIFLYQNNPGAKVVVHAHPPYATAAAVAGRQLPVNMLPESALLLTPITYISYQMPGSQGFADAFISGIEQGSNVFLLGNHGVTVTGGSMTEAFARIETLEFLSRVSYLTGAEPGSMEIPDDQIQAWLATLK